MKTVVITGGAGFIGSNLTRTLLKRGYKVRVVDNLATGRMSNLDGILQDITFIKGDVCNMTVLKKAFKEADYVLHQAAIPSVPRSILNPAATHKANVDGTFNVLLAARDAGVKKVVLASSSSVYGNRKSKGYHKKEILRPQPLSPYAATKLVDEWYAKIFAHVYGLPTVCLRYFNVFGHYQDPNSEYAAVIPKFIKNVLAGKEITVYGDGMQTRDFTYIDNVVEANILAMENKKTVMGETINIACGDRISIKNLVREIGKITKKKPRVRIEPTRPGEVRHSSAENKKAKKLLGWQPTVRFKDGLKRTIEWYQEN